MFCVHVNPRVVLFFIMSKYSYKQLSFIKFSIFCHCPGPRGCQEKVLVPIPLSAGDPLFYCFTCPDIETVCHRGLYPLPQVCEGVSGGRNSRNESSGIPAAGLRLLFQMPRMSSQSRLFPFRLTSLENGGRRKPFEEVCSGVPGFWCCFGIDDQGQSPPVRERNEKQSADSTSRLSSRRPICLGLHGLRRMFEGLSK